MSFNKKKRKENIRGSLWRDAIDFPVNVFPRERVSDLLFYLLLILHQQVSYLRMNLAPPETTRRQMGCSIDNTCLRSWCLALILYLIHVSITLFF